MLKIVSKYVFWLTRQFASGWRCWPLACCECHTTVSIVMIRCTKTWLSLPNEFSNRKKDYYKCWCKIRAAAVCHCQHKSTSTLSQRCPIIDLSMFFFFPTQTHNTQLSSVVKTNSQTYLTVERVTREVPARLKPSQMDTLRENNIFKSGSKFIYAYYSKCF